MRKNAINLRIKSSLATDLSVELFNTSSITSPANQRTQYNWDITAQDFSFISSVTMQYKTSASDAFTSKTVTLLTKDKAGVLQALNSLNVGVFFSYTDTGVLYISVLNDKIIYGSFDVSEPGPPTDTLLFIADGANVNGNVWDTASALNVIFFVALNNDTGNPVDIRVRLYSAGSADVIFPFGIFGAGYAESGLPYLKSLIAARANPTQFITLEYRFGSGAWIILFTVSTARAVLSNATAARTPLVVSSSSRAGSGTNQWTADASMGLGIGGTGSFAIGDGEIKALVTQVSNDISGTHAAAVWTPTPLATDAQGEFFGFGGGVDVPMVFNFSGNAAYGSTTYYKYIVKWGAGHQYPSNGSYLIGSFF